MSKRILAKDSYGNNLYEGDKVRLKGLRGGYYWNEDKIITMKCCALCSHIYADGYDSNKIKKVTIEI
jgi:hypothetical protein